MVIVRRPLLLRSAAMAIIAAGLVACAPAGERGPGGAGTPTRSPSTTPAAPLTETPTPTPTPTQASPTEQALELVTAMTPRERAATVVMGHAPGIDPSALVSALHAGPQGLILMGDNIAADPEQQRALIDAVSAATDPAPLIGIDQEGGDVARLPWDDAPSARELKGADPAEVADAFAARARQLDEAGITVNFGIVADLPRDDASFIFSRAYGTDPEEVAGAVRGAVDGEQGRVLSTLKHFPGHGAAEGDSHSSIPTTEMPLDEWRSADAVPFEAGIDAGAELVMMGHLRFTAVDERPASLSPEWYRVLREDLGFDGVAVTDDLGMLLSSGDPAYEDAAGNAVEALRAGADLVLMIAGSTPESQAATVDRIAAAARNGELPEGRLAEAAQRVLALRLDADPGE